VCRISRASERERERERELERCALVDLIRKNMKPDEWPRERAHEMLARCVALSLSMSRSLYSGMSIVKPVDDTVELPDADAEPEPVPVPVPVRVIRRLTFLRRRLSSNGILRSFWRRM